MADEISASEKKFYLKVFGSQKLYDVFVKLFHQAVADRSASPKEKAMILFRDKYEETEDGWREL